MPNLHIIVQYRSVLPLEGDLMKSKYAFVASFFLAACLFILAPATGNAAPVSKLDQPVSSASLPTLEKVHYRHYRHCHTRYKKRCSVRWWKYKKVYRCYKVPYRYCHGKRHYRRYH